MKTFYLQCARLILASCVVLLYDVCKSSEQDSTCILVVDPIAGILCDINKREPVDVQIVAYTNRYPQGLYEGLSECRQIRLYTRFDELLRLKEQIAEDSKAGFIGSVKERINYIPDGYLFASIDKENDQVVLRAEILDRSERSLAIASCRIGFSRFLQDSVVNLEIGKLATKLCGEFCRVPERKKPNPFMSFRLSFSVMGGGDRVTLSNLPQDIRVIPPHPDDVQNRPNDIADTTILDNYLIAENIAHLETNHSTSIEIEFCFWGILNIGIASSRIERFGLDLGESLFRKAYIEANPGDPYSGSALIFYGIEARERDYFSKGSFSIPISFSYPVWNIGNYPAFTFRAEAGTDLLLPSTIQLQSRQGWDRFGAREDQRVSDIGEIKVVHYFTGLDVESAIASWGGVGLQASLCYSEYREDLRDGINLEVKDKLHPSIKAYWILDSPW